MLGDTIHILRNQKHMSEQELADVAGISSAAISLYESGKGRIEAEVVAKIAKALDISVLELVNGCQLLYDDNQPILMVRRIDKQQIRYIAQLKADI